MAEFMSVKDARKLALAYHKETKWHVKDKDHPVAGYYYTDKPQLDKIGHPYIEHLEGVRMGVIVFGGDEEVQAAALLHDIVEDTDMTFAGLLERGASARQVKIVKALTKVTNEAQTIYLGRIIAAGVDAMQVKLADLMNNRRPDRVKELSVDTAKRQSEKYLPSIARLMEELGYIVQGDDYSKVPKGTALSSYSTGAFVTGQWGERTMGWFTGGDECKVEGDKVLIVAKKDSLAGGKVKLTFTNGDDFTANASHKLQGRIPPTTSPSKPAGTSATSTATTSYTEPTCEWTEKVPAFFNAGDWIKLADDEAVQVRTKFVLPDGITLALWPKGDVTFENVKLESGRNYYWKPRAVIHSPIAPPVEKTGSYAWDKATNKTVEVTKPTLEEVLGDNTFWDEVEANAAAIPTEGA